jgi:TorA maturation chaperone TorD
MRDAGLQEAIRVAGGISALARRLGVSQPSISEWTRIPAERVAAVEAVTGIARGVLRPDLFAEGVPQPEAPNADPIDQARAGLYVLLGSLIMKMPEERILIEIKALSGDDTALGQAVNALAEAVDVPNAEAIARDHFNLFVGVGRGELLPFGSYYLTGFLYERPLVRIRQDMKRLGIERAESQSEPEDHIGFLFDIMAGLITGRFSAERSEEARFFARHIEPWAERLFADLAKTETAGPFYRAAGRLGVEFMRIEREAFALEAATSTDAA